MTAKTSGPTDPTLPAIVDRLVEAYRPERVYLFGSRARGDVDADSDYDMLVVVPDNAGPTRRASRLGYVALRGTGVAVDVVVTTSSDFRGRLHVPSSLPATAVREGVVLYGA